MSSTTTMLLPGLGLLVLTGALAVAGGTDEQIQEPIPLTVWAPWEASNFGENSQDDTWDIEEHTGYHINWLSGPHESPFADLVLLIVSGDAPDLLYSIPPGYYGELARQGVLLPIEGELIKPYQREFSNIPDDLWKTAEAQGTVYGVPHDSASWSTGVPTIRNDLETRVGDLSTAEGYVEFLRKLKTENPTSTPMTGVGSATWVGISPFCSFYDTCANYMLRNGEIVDTRVDPKTKELLGILHELVEEGLLDKNYVNNDSETLSEIVTHEKVALISFNNPWQIQQMLTELGEISDGRTYRPFLPQLGAMRNEELLSTPESFSSITVASRHPTDAMHLMAEYYKLRGAYDSVYLPQDFGPEILGNTDVSDRLNDLTVETFSRIIAGNESLNAFDDFVEEWRNLGGEDVLEEVNSWWSDQEGN